MPYKLRKIRNKDLYKVYNTETKKIHSKGTSLDKAKAQIRLLNQLEKTGGALEAKYVDSLINESYETKPKEQIDDRFELDKSLSSKRVKVYKDKQDGKVYVINRGSYDVRDWVDNLKFLKSGRPQSKTYKEAKDIQNKVIQKYGKDNIENIGHSRGGLVASSLLDEGLTNKAITYNRPFHITDYLKKKNENLYDIKTKYDPVSFLNRRPDYVIEGSKNPIYAHSITQLDKIDDNQLLGKGFMEGGYLPLYY